MNTKEKDALINIILFTIAIIVISIVIRIGIDSVVDNINKPLEYSYKNFSEHDIELAMKFNGCLSVTITETECYFVRNNKKCNLFNDATIKYLYENKQKEVEGDIK